MKVGVGVKLSSASSTSVSSEKSLTSKEKSSGTKITIGLSQSTNNATTLTNNSANQSSQIIDNLSTSVTISDLCNLPDGRRLQNKRKRADNQGNGSNKGSKSSLHSRSGTNRSEAEQVSGPQVEIINGKIVIKESSLMVPSVSTEHEDFEEVEEGIHPTAKYSSFTPPVYSSAWGIDETKRFYEALRQCGTDFSLMQAFFPRRTRKQLKNKFYREESRHPELIKATLNSLIPLDLAPFEVHLGHILPEDANQNSYPTQELPAIEPIFGVDVSSLADNSVSYAPPPSIDDSELVDV